MGSWKSSGYGCFVINSGLQQYRVKAMLRVLINAQITGKGCRALRQLPATVYDRLQSSSHDIAHLCIELDNALVVNDVNSCQEALSKSAQSLCECNNTNHQLNRKAFVLFGGDILLLRALFLKFPSPADVEKLSFTVKVLYIRNECLSILRELCLTVHSFIEYLAADDVFVVKLFDMMRLHNTFDNAVNLAEEVLAIRQDTWPVQGVPNLTSLVSNFSSRQLASFCRVLAMVVFEPEGMHGWARSRVLKVACNRNQGSRSQNGRRLTKTMKPFYSSQTFFHA